MKKVKKQFSNEIKQRAVEEFISGRRSAVELASEIGCSVNLIYRWKSDFEGNKRVERVSELEAAGHNPADIRRIMDLEDELEEYKKKLAEQILITDLLKKLQDSRISPPESELTGLIRTTKNSARKRKPVK